MSGEKTYRVREKVPQTGMYRVVHYQHRLPHNVMMRQGEHFPACNICGERVRFRVSDIAEPLVLDSGFLGKAA